MRILLMTCVVSATCFVAPHAHGQVKSSVFDDVKIWYKGSAGNAIGTSDTGTPPYGTSSGGRTDWFNKMKNLAAFATADMSSGANGLHDSAHGGKYFWWAWRMQYDNQKVDCPYAGCTLDSTPCMIVPKAKDGSGNLGPTGYSDVTVNGVTTNLPYYTEFRFGGLYFNNWMSDWASDTVCSNYTCVLRFRSDMVNPASGNGNKIIEIGNVYDNTAGRAAGFSLILNPNAEAFAEFACPRLWVGTVQKNFTDWKIRSGRWVDCAIAVDGHTVNLWFCWNDGTDEVPTNRLARKTVTYPASAAIPTLQGGSVVYLASAKNAYSGTYTNGVYSADLSNKAFQGAFHQIAFWDRTLSDNEVREAMAGGTGRPNLIQVGVEGNGVAEFAPNASETRVSNTGAWEHLNPTLTAANSTATIAFTCQALWVGKPQYLRVSMAATSTAGRLSVALNGETMGAVTVNPGKVALLYVPENKIVSGDNTLVLTRTSGESLVLDAVTMGGSWQFGESISSFTYQNAATENPDNYLFNPACGSDEIHHRGMRSNVTPRETYFDFFIPADMVGKYRGVFTTRTQNTGGYNMNYDFSVNGVKLCDCALKGGTLTSVEIPSDALIGGWNRVCWIADTGGDWANIDWHKFEVLSPPQGLTLIIR